MGEYREHRVVRPGDQSFVVGIGASAGGLEALEQFFAATDPSGDMAYVVVQHLSPDHKSMMAELLSRHTSMPVRVITEGMRPETNTVSLIPPKMNLTLKNGMFVLTEKPNTAGLNLPIDIFFKSLAENYGDHAVAVVLSGTGSDGTRGVRAVHEAGGLVIAQTPSTARFDGMPRSAIAEGITDLVADVSAMPPRLKRMAESGHIGIDLSTVEAVPSGPDAIQRVLRLVSDETGVNFSGYKKTTVGRRLARRMALNHITDPTDYLVFVQASQDERDDLFRDLLIGVTRFFRDRDVWTQLQRDVISPLVANAPTGSNLRMWVPGCSTGEEAFTLAMLVNEEMTNQRRSLEVKIFATDIDKRAIERASRGVFLESVVADVEPDRLQRHFTRHGDIYEVKPDIRQMVMFAMHNLTRDPPFTRLDLISCRNLLIYFDQVLQEQAMRSFNFGLKQAGVLLLGSSESVGDMSDRFAPIDAKRRLFRSVGPQMQSPWMNHDAAQLGAAAASQNAQLLSQRNRRTQSRTTQDDPLTVLAARYLPPALLVSSDFRLVEVFGNAGDFVKLRPGVADFRITDMVHPSISRVISSGIPSSLRSGTPSTFQPVIAADDGPEHSVRIIPLVPESGPATTALVVFDSVRPTKDDRVMTIDPQMADQLSLLQRELELSLDSQQNLVEELETSNEELQAANEELLASNEELQASNEELQSVNEELHTVNAEYQQKFLQHEQISNDLDHLLSATDIGTLFLDGDLAIRKFTPSIANFLPLLDRDLGRPIGDLSVQIGGPEFLADLSTVLQTEEVQERTVDTLSGPVLIRILPYRVQDQVGVLVTFTNVSDVKRTYDLARRVLDALPAQVAFISADGSIRMVNREWERFGEENGAENASIGVGVNYLDMCSGEDGEAMRKGIGSVLRGEIDMFTLEYPCHTPTENRWFLARCTATTDRGEAVIVHFDVTAQKRAEEVLAVLATHDHLTGVLNRRGFDQQLGIEHNRIRRTGVPSAALLIDCDDFKQINEKLGLVGGDAVLSTVAKRIQHALRPGDTMARIGGDEFVVLLPEVRIAEAEVVAERIRLAVASTPVALSHADIGLTVSAAVVVIDETVHTLEVLLERTRYALTASKKEGKNRIAISGTERRETTLLGEYQQDLARLTAEPNSLFAVVQPIVDLTSRETKGYELLTRTTLVSSLTPLTMFQLAQEGGVLNALDERCLRLGLKTATEILPGMKRNINLYPSTLMSFSEETIVDLFSDLPPNTYYVELSEQQILGEASYLLPRINSLRNLGVGIAIDDVGFGRTALESLIILEPEIVKIDRTYIDGVADDPTRQRWLVRLVRAARSLGSDLIAEGIETERDANAAAELGIRLGQGYFYGRPDHLVPSNGIPSSGAANHHD
jgi:two-component system, chemotaxis family, CheB/CheR fusion protein